MSISEEMNKRNIKDLKFNELNNYGLINYEGEEEPSFDGGVLNALYFTKGEGGDHIPIREEDRRDIVMYLLNDVSNVEFGEIMRFFFTMYKNGHLSEVSKAKLNMVISVI